MLSRAWLKNSSCMKKASYFRFSHSLCSSPFPTLLRAGDFFFFFFLVFLQDFNRTQTFASHSMTPLVCTVTPQASPSPPRNQAAISTGLLVVLLSYRLALQWPLLQATVNERPLVGHSANSWWSVFMRWAGKEDAVLAFSLGWVGGPREQARCCVLQGSRILTKVIHWPWPKP